MAFFPLPFSLPKGCIKLFEGEKKKSQKQHVSLFWHGLKRWDVIVYTKRSICWRKFAAFRYGRVWSASEETRAVESEGREMTGGKYFPDSLMIASCQITNWISSCWRRVHSLHLFPSNHCFSVPLSLRRRSDKMSPQVTVRTPSALAFSSLTCTEAAGWAGSAPACWCSSAWRWARPGRGCWWTPWWCPWGTTGSSRLWSSQCTCWSWPHQCQGCLKVFFHFYRSLCVKGDSHTPRLPLNT